MLVYISLFKIQQCILEISLSYCLIFSILFLNGRNIIPSPHLLSLSVRESTNNILFNNHSGTDWLKCQSAPDELRQEKWKRYSHIEEFVLFISKNKLKKQSPSPKN